MKNYNLKRRTFIKGSIGAGIALSGIPFFSSCSTYDAKDLPTTFLGSTGMRIPKIALGLGSRFCNIDDENQSTEMLNYALDNGLYYWDTAHIYNNKKNGVISEERVGKIIKYRRNEIFLSTKVSSRNPDEAKREIESSLKRLQTDKLDILKIHSVNSMEDVDQMSKKGQLIDVLHRIKEQEIARFIGFSGHADALAMKTMAERGDFDTMLIAMNHWDMKRNPQQRQELAVPAALDKGMGVMLMKVVRPGENIKSLNPVDLIRFALSLNGPNGIVLGVDSLEVVKSNLQILRNFTEMTIEEKETLVHELSPYFKHKNLEWMHPTYKDGNWV
ncbi:MAG: aldo/keto reductase [Draconibacterium sp.]